MRLTDYDKLQLKLREYADKKAANGEIELANGILKAKCFIDQECEIVNKKQVSSGWIPVRSKGLPKEKGFYIFQLEDNRIHEYYYKNNALYGDCDIIEGINEVAFSLNEVIAWQPLPEPFKGGENE